MKRCPECRRDYYDDTLLYCLDDGNALLEGPATASSDDEPATAILSEQGGIATVSPASESPTPAQIHTTDKTAVFQHGTEAELQSPLGASAEKRSFSANRAAKPLAALIAVILLLAAGFFGYRHFKSGTAEQINSIAVLPFENKSGNADTDYLSDGLSDSLIYRLTQLPNIKVSPTSSVIRYKGKQTDIADVAKELEVDAVMSGKVAQRGDDLTISVELTDARTRKLIWAEQYDRKMAELLAIQREIATTIAQKLELKLAGDAAKGITKKYTDNNEAYQLYLKGRFYWNKRDEENLRKGIEQFRSATEKDPNFALAFVGLADCYVLLPYYSSAPSSEVLPQAKAYAERALEIDNSLGEAHTSLGYVHRLLWNWAEAEKELKRGVELNPNYATAHKFYGNLLSDLRRTDESLAAYKRAQELEPLSLIIKANLAEHYLYSGDVAAAVEQCRQAIDLDPNWHYIRQPLSLAFLKQGLGAQAVAEAEKGVELSRRLSQSLGVLGVVYSQTGRRNEAAAVIQELTEKYNNREANGFDLARIYFGLGDKDQGFAWLEKDLQSRNATMPNLIDEAPFDTLLDDPRFKDLRRRIGFPE